MIAFLIAVPVVLISFMIFISVYVVKNIKHSEPEKGEPPVKEEKWEHIRDFSDINSQNDNKINSFGNGFEDDARTVGADLSNYIKDNSVKDINKDDTPNQSNNIKSNNSLGQSDSSDFINDFRTVSINEQGILDIPDDDDSDKTVDMFQSNQMERALEKIEVTLRYKDGSYNKLVKMETSQITVGRGAGNDLMFRSDSFTSRNHAVFTIKDGKLYLKDLKSKNGTYVNSDERIEGEVMLEKSCDVTFGDVVVNVSIKYR